ncbi:hypothetical protein BH09PSE6_BH09PSE6_02070 [soil metagenome]
MIRKLWRGDLPVLATLLIAGGVLVLVLAPIGLARSLTAMAESPILWSRLTVVLRWGLVLGLFWLARGLYRSASNESESHGAGVGVAFGKAVSLISFAVVGWLVLGLLVGRSGTIYRLALGKTQSPAFQILALPDRISFEGEFDLGAAATLTRVLDANPSLRLVEFKSPGGLSLEGLAVARTIERVNADTLVTDYCASACVTAFSGGRRRFVTPRARIGLHSSGGVDDMVLIHRTNIDHIVYMTGRGVDWALMSRGSQVAFNDIWWPTTATVLASRLATDTWNPPLPPPGRR